MRRTDRRGGVRAAVTTVSATVDTSKVKVVHVDNRGTVSIVSHVCESGNKGGGVGRIPARAVRCKCVCSKRRLVSRILMVVVRTPEAFAKRSAMRVSYRNNMCTVREILSAILGGNTRVTRPKRFAGHTFLGKQVSLSRTRTIVSIVRTGGRCTLHDSVSRLENSIRGTVQSVERGLVCGVTCVRSTLSSPRRVDLSKCPRRLLRIISGRRGRIGHLLGASSSKGVVRRKVRAIVLKGPGTKGSSLLGLLVKRGQTVIASVTKAAESVLRRCVALRKVSLGVVSATKVQRAGSVIRGVKMSETERVTRGTSLVLCMISSSIPLSRGSRRVVRVLAKGGTVVLCGGASLRPRVRPRVLGRGAKRPMVPVSTGRRGNVARLRRRVGSVFFKKRVSFGSRMCVAGTHRGTTLRRTSEDLSLIEGDVRVKVPRSFFSVSLVGTCRGLNGVLKRSINRSLMGRVFDGFYVNGWGSGGHLQQFLGR